MFGSHGKYAWIGVWLATTTIVACNEAGGSAGLEAAVDTVDGVPRYTYPAEGGAMLPWSRDTMALIGEAFSDEDVYQFDRVPNGGVAGDSDGNLYILDVAGSRVLSFDTEGRHRATYGRQGEGPGELAQPFGLGIGVGDTVWVLDPLNSRFTGFPDDGGNPRVVGIGGNGGFPSPGFAVLPRGFVVQGSPALRLAGGGRVQFSAAVGASARSGVRSAPPPDPTSNDEDDENAEDDRFIPIQHVTFDGTTSTIWRSLPPEAAPTQLGDGGSRSLTVVMIAMPPAFSPQLRWGAFQDGGLVVSDKDSYELILVAPDGNRRGLILRNMPPWPVTDIEKEHARQQLRERNVTIRGMNIDMSQFIEQQVQNMTFSETVPRIAGLAVDQQDRIWVGVALDTPGEIDRVDLYSKTGEFLGSLDNFEIPAAFFGNGLAASLFRDPDTDIQRVAVYRVSERTPR
jgi:hypothetical protein